jgi:protocatechuate 3,4-dioxygenase beta subunit
VGGGKVESITDSQGNYTMSLEPATYMVVIEKEGFEPQTIQKTIESGVTTILSASLQALPDPEGILKGQITDANGNPIEGAKVTATKA